MSAREEPAHRETTVRQVLTDTHSGARSGHGSLSRDALVSTAANGSDWGSQHALKREMGPAVCRSQIAERVL